MNFEVQQRERGCSNAATPPLRPALLISCISFLLVHASVFAQGVRLLISHASEATDPYSNSCRTSNLHHFGCGVLHYAPLMVLPGLKLVTITIMLYISFCNISRRLSIAESADWNLIYLGLILPVSNLNFFFNLPSFDVTQRNWPVFYAFLMALGVYGAEFPMPHLLVQWMATAPVMMYLDYQKHYKTCLNLAARGGTCATPWLGRDAAGHLSRQADGLGTLQTATAAAGACGDGAHACGMQCGDKAFLCNYLLTSGIYIVAVGMASVIITLLICRKFPTSSPLTEAAAGLGPAPDPQSSAPTSAEDTCRPSPCEVIDWPLETFGLRVVDPTCLAAGLLPRLDAGIASIARRIGPTAAVALFCLPLGSFYLLRIMLARMTSEESTLSLASVSPEEWLMVLVVFFLLGRESCHVDTKPLLDEIKIRLSASRAILADMMPSHVVELLLSHSTRTAEEARLDIDLDLPGDVEGDRDEEEEDDEDGSIGGQSVPRRQPSSLMSRGSSNQLLHAQHSFSFRSVRSHANSHLTAGNDSKNLRSGSPGVSSFSVAESHDCITILFSDIVGFSTWARHLPSNKVMSTLNDLYSRLDDILIDEIPSLYKVETIGDAYLVAANLVKRDPQHAATMVQFALRAHEEAAKVLRPDLDDGTTLQIRAGIHSGPAVSGIVGKLRRRFTVFGDTVNMASRAETACPPGRTQLTASSHALAGPHLLGSGIVLTQRGPVVVKGAEEPIMMYLAHREEDATVEAALVPPATAALSILDLKEVP